MDLQKAQDLCLQLMDKHGLTKEKGWSFKWINSKRAAGRCLSKRKMGIWIGGEIMLSTFVTQYHSEEKVLDTILHEIAHGLTPGHHHDYVWRMKAIEIGCNGQRCYDVSDSNELEEAHKATAKIIGTCPLCDRKWYQSRMPKRNQWCKCAGRRFRQEEKIVYVENTTIKTTVSKPTPKVKASGNVTPGAQRPDAYKGMLEKFEREFLPLINNNKSLFIQITHQAMQNNSWRTQNREVRKACNKYMFENGLMTNQRFQEMFFYEGPMNGRTTHGTKAPWIGGHPS